MTIYKVEIEGNSGFILDTDLLDTGRLGYLTTDVTSYVRSVSVNRGKSTDLDEYTAGQMSVVFDNRDRAFDPDYTSSPLYGAIVPRRRIRFSAGYDANSLQSQFFGFIDDWNFDYDVSGDSTASASCSDAFTVLANQNITLTTPASELSDARITRVLTNSQVAWPLSNFFSEGAAFTMNSTTYTGNALSYLQQIAASENGMIYVNRSGVITFLGWNEWAGYIGDYPPEFFFGDDGSSSRVPFTNIETTYGTEQLYNYVTVTGSAGTVTAQDVTSQIAYQIASTNIDVVTAGTAQMQVLADYTITKYKDPIFRVSSLTVSLDGVEDMAAGSALATSVFQADFGWVTEIDWTPNRIGTQTQRLAVIVGKNIQASPDRCDITFRFIPLDNRSIQ